VLPMKVAFGGLDNVRQHTFNITWVFNMNETMWRALDSQTSTMLAYPEVRAFPSVVMMLTECWLHAGSLWTPNGIVDHQRH
jgi:hypothetical protein